MTLNKDQAQHTNNELHQEAQRGEILAIIKQDGPQYCGQIARKAGMTPRECREYLVSMTGEGEIDFSWITGRYSV